MGDGGPPPAAAAAAAAAPAAAAVARVPVSWTDFVDVNGANGYVIAKRTAPPPPSSAKKKAAKAAQPAAAASAEDDSGPDILDHDMDDEEEEKFEVAKILGKRTVKGKVSVYPQFQAICLEAVRSFPSSDCVCVYRLSITYHGRVTRRRRIIPGKVWRISRVRRH